MYDYNESNKNKYSENQYNENQSNKTEQDFDENELWQPLEGEEDQQYS